MGKTTQICNIKLDSICHCELISKVDSWIKYKDQRSHHIATINAYCVSLALKNKRLAKIYNSADITGPDGEPFVKWMKHIKNQNTDKICARDTILALIMAAKVKNYSFYLYGGHPHVLDVMVENLKRDYPFLNIVGHYSPPFRPLTVYEDLAVIETINKLRPDIILVGLGTPNQDYWIEDHLYKIKGSVMITCGATFDFFGGRVKMAPKWIQKSGFEWMFRLFGKDFKRLWKRYTINNAIFLWNFFLQQLRLKDFNILVKKRFDETITLKESLLTIDKTHKSRKEIYSIIEE